MALRLPLCLFNRHAPTRNRVKWDGLNFVGTCRFCKKAIRKQHHGSWRKDWMESSGHHQSRLDTPPPATTPLDD
jgi:hypothetical protein